MQPLDVSEAMDFKESDVEYWLENYKPVVTYGHGMKQLESDNYFDAFYSAHVSQMTKMDLHSKSSIAAELAYRDYIIVHLMREKMNRT